MKFEALSLVITGAFMHAVWNLLAKKASGGLSFVWMYGLASLALAFPLSLGFWLHSPQPVSNPIVLAALFSAVLHIVYSLVLQQGYRASDFSIVYPLARGTGPLFSVLGAILILSESPTLPGWIGISLIFIGVFFIAGSTSFFTKLADSTSRRGIGWGMLTGLMISCYTLVDGWSVKVLEASPIFFYALSLMFRSVLLAPFALRNPTELRSQWRQNRHYIIAVGTLSPFAYVLVLFSIKIAPLSYIAPAREVSMMMGAYLGARFLKEEDLRSRTFGTVLMALGTLGLAIG